VRCHGQTENQGRNQNKCLQRGRPFRKSVGTVMWGATLPISSAR
jgi:hypothetical protein